MAAELPRVSAAELKDWTARVFMAGGVPEADARLTAEVLVLADLRGIDSHGVARLPFYLMKLKNQSINPKPRPAAVHESPATALFDGDNGLGPVAAKPAMELAIGKARRVGAGFVAVRNSNHFGIAAYYSQMALAEEMIGISMTNAVALMAPTFGRQGLLGTNPLSVAVPAGRLRPFLLDMATSTVPVGKIELALRNNASVPLGWVLDSQGRPTPNPKDMFQGGTLTPLGGDREQGGHKGYGLALLIDILSAVLPLANYGARQEGLTSMRPEPSNVGHFFGALKIEGFRPLEEFKATMDQALSAIQDSPKALGRDRILIHGEPEFEAEDERRRLGIPLHPEVRLRLKKIGQENKVLADFLA